MNPEIALQIIVIHDWLPFKFPISLKCDDNFVLLWGSVFVSTCTYAALTLLTLLWVVDLRTARAGCFHRRFLILLPLFSCWVVLILAVTLTQLVKTKVFDLVAGAAGCSGVSICGLSLKAKKLQFCLLFTFTLSGSEPKKLRQDEKEKYSWQNKQVCVFYSFLHHKSYESISNWAHRYEQNCDIRPRITK